MLATGGLVIKIDAIVANWQRLSQLVRPVECGAVVKANAYGLGVAPVAIGLQSAGCKTFFVATLDEAIELRESLGPASKIIALGGQAAKCHKECQHYQLTPVLISEDHINTWLSCAEGLSIPTIVKLDTGMHRFGLLPDQFENLLSKKVFQRLQPQYLMSHLACADTSGHLQNSSQLNGFIHAYQQLKHQLPHCRASLANSSACFLGDKYHFDLCRPGIALYGGNPTPSGANPMQSVVELRLPIMQIKSLKKGDAVGYGAQYRAPHSARIAIVFGGYADGLFRYLHGQGGGFVGDHIVPMVGRVSMDAIAFDVSSVPDEVLKNHSDIEILGEHQSIDDLAEQAGTISYEILTSLGSRYQRHYLTSDQAG